MADPSATRPEPTSSCRVSSPPVRGSEAADAEVPDEALVEPFPPADAVGAVGLAGLAEATVVQRLTTTVAPATSTGVVPWSNEITIAPPVRTAPTVATVPPTLTGRARAVPAASRPSAEVPTTARRVPATDGTPTPVSTVFVPSPKRARPVHT